MSLLILFLHRFRHIIAHAGNFPRSGRTFDVWLNEKVLNLMIVKIGNPLMFYFRGKIASVEKVDMM
jgi:hypothetical protein